MPNKDVTTPPYEPRVVVKLRSDEGGAQPTKAVSGDALKALLEKDEKFSGLVVERLFPALEPYLLTRRATAAASGTADDAAEQEETNGLRGYFRLSVPPEIVEELVSYLSGQSLVEHADLEEEPTDLPLADPVAFPVSPDPIPQLYLGSAPVGIDAEFAWNFPGGSGQGVRVIDIEQGWVLDHNDLAAQGIRLLSGMNSRFFGHGTAVLGILAAVDNGEGIVGIVPHLESVAAVSQWRAPGSLSTARAVFSALGDLRPGDVVLIESQKQVPGVGSLPVEVSPAIHDIIRFAVAQGIVVIEAAGNGGVDLDTFNDPKRGRVLAPGQPGFKESGAILVGAATAAPPHERIPASNFGSRVDCYAWGERVATTGDGDGGREKDRFTRTFNGTSAAAAIVAGAAISLQGIVKAHRGEPLTPKEMRDLLRDPANGTPSADLIGVMPDLRKIVQKVLNLS